MDEKRTGSKDSIVSSLTESWNIVENNDVNDTPEGSSDGESIEVIDEDANNLEEKNNKKQDTNIEEINSTECNNDDDDDDDEIEEDEILITSSQIDDHQTFEPIINEISFLNLVNKYYNDFEVRKLLAMMTIGVVIITTFICSIITVSAFINAHTVAIDFFDFISMGNNERVRNYEQFEPRELYGAMGRLASCESNIVELRASIQDLREEVQEWKEIDLGFKYGGGSAHFYNKLRKFELSIAEKRLFKELFGIQMSKYPSINLLEDEINFNDGREVKMLVEMICNSTSGLELENNMRDVHLFNLIPEQLALLTKVNPANKNIEFFINNWKNKLEDMNARIMADHRELQLRMIRQLMKHMKSTYSEFHSKLCILMGFKDSKMCNEYKKYLEQISMSHSKANHPSSDESITEDAPGKKQPTNDLPTGKPSNIRIDKQAKILRKNVKDDQILDEGEMFAEGKEMNQKQRIQSKNIKKNDPDRKCTKALDNEHSNLKHRVEIKEKLGMSNDLKSDSPNNDQINSFSSFSNAQGVKTETACPEKTEKECWEGQEEMLTGQQSSDTAEGSWFLDIGNQRSKLRTSEAVSDWLFERARYRSTNKP